MAYLNTKWIFKFNDNKTNIQFVVREENKQIIVTNNEGSSLKVKKA